MGGTSVEGCPQFVQSAEPYLSLPPDLPAAREMILERLRADIQAMGSAGRFVGLHLFQWNPEYYDIDGLLTRGREEGMNCINYYQRI